MDQAILNLLQQNKDLFRQMQVRDEQLTQLITKLAQGQPAGQALAPWPAREQDATALRVKNLTDTMSPFTYDAENNRTFEAWYNRHELILTIQAEGLEEATKVQMMLQKFSDEDYQRFADAILPKKPTDLVMVEAVKLLKAMFGQKETKFALRHKCFALSKLDSEDYNQYGARINKHAEKFDIKTCDADDLKVLLFISGLKSPQESLILEKLLAKVDAQHVQLEAAEDEAARNAIQKLNLQSLINEAFRLITLKKDKSTVVESTKSAEVYAIQRTRQQTPRRNDQSSSTPTPSTGAKDSKQPATLPKSPCPYCGGLHWARDCTFRTEECRTCKREGHKAGFCDSAIAFDFNRKQKLNRQRQRNHSDPQRKVNQITEANDKVERKFIAPSINGSRIKLQLDSASDITVISYENWKKLGQPSLAPSTINPGSASGDEIHLFGSFNCRMYLNGTEKEGRCYVASNLNLLGIDWISALGLWNVPFSSICNLIKEENGIELTQEVLKKFPSLFSEGLGRCNKFKVSLTLKRDAKPVFRKARPVPFAAAPAIASEISRLQHLGVITPVKHAAAAAPIVAVKKRNGEIRVCGDYSTGLNEALEPNSYPLPTPEQIFAKLAGKKIFSKLDLSDAFLQLELDDESKELASINTQCGIFNVNRLQPGIKTAPGTFQQLMDTMLSGLEGSFAFIDDAIAAGVNTKDHRDQLFKVLERLQDYGLKLRIDKCQFGCTEIPFCGYIVDSEGIRPDPEKLNSIKNIGRPTDVSKLRSFLGAVNYYGKFVKGMKNLRGPLDELLRKDAKFIWTPTHEQAFVDLKDVMASELVLTHYDPTKKIVVAADASSYGIGAVIMHEFSDGTLHPIMHASTSLNSAEQNYPQIQREALALTFAVKKFHKYIYGRRFELQTDHKPLLAIFGAKGGIPVHTASRLQRYALTLLAYDFSIKYIDTASFGYADVVSRLISDHQKSDEDVIIAIIRTGNDEKCFAISSVESLITNFATVQNETKKCPVLKQVAEFSQGGWPQSAKLIANPEVRKFFTHRDELIIIENCIFRGDRIVIPKQLQQDIIKQLHDGHPGIVRMKLLARSKVFWPGIDNNIEEAVRTCETCATASKTPIKCTLQSWPTPTAPWTRIHIDYAGPISGFYYLVIVDAYSKWPEVFKTTSITSAKTIELLEEVFARQGLCDTLVSDNGTQFTSEEFKAFCKTNGIDHVTTAPYSPQSNGQAERFVDLLKTGLSKATGNTDQKLRQFLRCYRYTPSYTSGNKSPFELMTNRTMKTKLDILKPPKSLPIDRNEAMEQQFDAYHGAKYKEFAAKDDVYFQLHSSTTKWNWVPARVIERIGAVNYRIEVHTAEGVRITKAHANQLKSRFPRNEIVELFEIPDAQEGEIEPIIQPQCHDEQELDDTEIFEDAVENIDEPGPPQEPQVVVEEHARRSERTNKGVPPQRFGWN